MGAKSNSLLENIGLPWLVSKLHFFPIFFSISSGEHTDCTLTGALSAHGCGVLSTNSNGGSNGCLEHIDLFSGSTQA